MDDLLLGPLGTQRARPDAVVGLGRLLAAGACALLLLAGCGGGTDGEDARTGLPPVGGGGTLTYALAALPASLDPLEAGSVPAQLVSRQVHEPLVAEVSPPYEDEPRTGGLALSLRPTPDRTVWRVTLRSGVRFQDGSPFNAAAVLANSRRWLTLAPGRWLLPGLFAVDAPRPGEVRFLFERRTADLPALLASPRLAIVSPGALRPPEGDAARFRAAAIGSGTGAFELASRDGGVLRLSRNAHWWGSDAGLGPSLDALDFVGVKNSGERAALLDSGEAQVVQPLEAATAATVTADPLLRRARISGVPAGMEASVRGLGSGSAVPTLSGVWLTRLPG